MQLQSASVARILTRIVPPRRCGGARKADPTRQPPGACIQASATAGSSPARHDSGPRGVADGAESAPEARPAAGWSPRALSGCRHGHLRSSCARCASRWPGAAARALCRCLLSLDGRRAPCSRPILSLPPASAPERPPPHTDYCRYDCRPSLSRPFVLSARTTDVLPPLRPRSGPLVDTRNQQTPVSELLCRLGASIADGGTPGPALSHTVERGTARAHAAHLCCLRRLCPGGPLIEHLTAARRPHHRDRCAIPHHASRRRPPAHTLSHSVMSSLQSTRSLGVVTSAPAPAQRTATLASVRLQTSPSTAACASHIRSRPGAVSREPQPSTDARLF